MAGAPVAFLPAQGDTRLDPDAPMPQGLAERGMQEQEWRACASELNAASRRFIGGCCTECWCAAISFTLFVLIPCWCYRRHQQERDMQEALSDISQRHLHKYQVHAKWKFSGKHGENAANDNGGVLFVHRA